MNLSFSNTCVLFYDQSLVNFLETQGDVMEEVSKVILIGIFTEKEARLFMKTQSLILRKLEYVQTTLHLRLELNYINLAILLEVAQQCQ